MACHRAGSSSERYTSDPIRGAVADTEGHARKRILGGIRKRIEALLGLQISLTRAGILFFLLDIHALIDAALCT